MLTQRNVLVSLVPVCLTAGLASGAAPLVLHVSPGGDDAASGRSADSAIRSLSRARDLVRDLRQSGRLPREGAQVIVHPGVYAVPDGLDFGSNDAAPENARIVFRAAEKGRAVLRGGVVLQGFRADRNGLLRLRLPTRDGKRLTIGQLFYDGRRMTPARSPNLDPADLHGGRWAHAVRGFGQQPRRRFIPGGDLGLPLSSDLVGARVCIFCRYDWRWNRIPIAAVDPDRRLITLARDATYPISPGDRFFIEGGQQPDAPGEWSVDRKTGELVFLPPADAASRPPQKIEVVVPTSDSLLTFEKTARIVFHGFVIEAAGADAVRIIDCDDVRLEACVIRNCGGWGVRVQGGRACRVDGCDIYDTGRGGILMNGGDRRSLSPAGHEAVNNVIHHVGVIEKTYNTGINLSGVGNAARHNHIYHTPHAGMVLGGNDNIVEFNHIHHTNLESADTGGIYSCPRDWTQRGNIVRWNVWHDIGGYGKKNSWRPVEDGKVVFEYPHFTWGIYMDDPTSGNLIYGNILYRVPVCALHNHGGRDNRFVNNIIIDCPAFQAGMLGPNWREWPRILDRFRWAVEQPDSPYLEHYPELRDYPGPRPEAMTGLHFERNIVYYTKAGSEWLRKWRKWGDAMRLYILRARPEDMARNVFDRNLVFAPPGLRLEIAYSPYPNPERRLTWEEWRKLGFDPKSLFADPGFVDPEHPERADFGLRTDSPAQKIGFEPIPVRKIVPFDSPNRATWPVVLPRGDRTAPPPVHQEFQIFPPRPARPFFTRDGLPHLAAKLHKSGTVRIAYFGGGIHPASGWRSRVIKWLQERFPKAKIETIDAGICDCVRGSAFSVYRFRHDVLQKKPDLVLVDFTSDDATADATTVERVAEGLVRQARRKAPETDLLFVYMFRKGFEEAYRKDRLPSSSAAWDRVAEWYHVPAVDMGLAVWNEIRQGRTALAPPAPEGVALFSKDGVRPTPETDAVYAGALIAALARLLSEHASPTSVPWSLPDPMQADNFENARLAPIRPSMLSGPWRELSPEHPLRKRFAAHFDTIWETTTPGARLTFRFRGTEAGLFALMGPDSGRIRVIVDGKEIGERGSADRWCYFQRFCGLTCASNVPEGEHRVEVELLPTPPDRSEAIAEARRLGQFKPGMFDGVALRVGWIRLVGVPLPSPRVASPSDAAPGD